jgi:hypothetical protein
MQGCAVIRISKAFDAGVGGNAPQKSIIWIEFAYATVSTEATARYDFPPAKTHPTFWPGI